ncbi:MAG: glutamine synthetase [archaeon]|nr:glutamine synthetase [archaeon]
MIEKDNPKRKEHIDKVMQSIDDNGINYIVLNFTDINGIIKSFDIRSKDIEDIFKDGAFFDGSSVTGYGSIEESDMVAVPDPTTFQKVPWGTNGNGVARLICDIYLPNGDRFAGDPRYILQRAVKKANDMGFNYYCAPELEFFILKESASKIAKPSDISGYFDWDPSGLGEQMRRKMSDYALKMGIEIECLHHEVATGQHEIDFRYGLGIETADNTISLKMIIKSVAAMNNAIATFMPKPFFGVNGSGMHVHSSLWKDGKNAFNDPNDPNHISDIMKQFMAGQLKYAEEMSAVLASWPNSYKRLVPGYEAPVYVAWGLKNRSSLIRVPNFGLKDKAARCEIRCPDPAGNPYLQFAVILASGLKGIEDKLQAPAPSDQNVYKLSTKEMSKLGLKAIPSSLGVALRIYGKSEFMKEVFGEKPFKNYLYAKLEEYDAYKMVVHDWELKRYMNKL